MTYPDPRKLARAAPPSTAERARGAAAGRARRLAGPRRRE